MKPKLLDLFCCAGGAAAGYARAGFEIVGVDREPQPNYPFEFHQGDALEYLAAHGAKFDVIHASPPCQAHSSITPNRSEHVDLIAPTRKLLDAIGLPYVMENVMGAPLRFPLMLCGTMFGLAVTCRDGIRRSLQRHRIFESSVLMLSPGRCRHSGATIGVYGDGGGGQSTRPSGGGGYKAFTDEAPIAMGIDWMNRRELSQAIPPAYTEYIGRQLAAYLSQRKRA